MAKLLIGGKPEADAEPGDGMEQSTAAPHVVMISETTTISASAWHVRTMAF